MRIVKLELVWMLRLKFSNFDAVHFLNGLEWSKDILTRWHHRESDTMDTEGESHQSSQSLPCQTIVPCVLKMCLLTTWCSRYWTPTLTLRTGTAINHSINHNSQRSTTSQPPRQAYSRSNRNGRWTSTAKSESCMAVAYPKFVVHRHYMYTFQQARAGLRRWSRPSRPKAPILTIPSSPASSPDIIVGIAIRSRGAV
jgi:hypothetical protein